MENSPLDLDAIRASCEAAKEWPWSYRRRRLRDRREMDPDFYEAALVALPRCLAVIEALREALNAVEWTARAIGYCGWCFGGYPYHRPDCQRQQALALVTGGKDG